jgi:Beta-propeller repeat
MNTIRTTLICTLLFASLFTKAQSSPQHMAWTRGIGGPSQDYGNSISVDNAGNVLTTGSFSDSMDVDPGPGVYKLISNGGIDIYLQKQDKSGHLLWATSFGDITDDYDNAVTTDASGSVYVTGSFTGTIDADPGPAVFNLTSQGTDIFIIKLDTDGNFLWGINVGGPDSDIPYAITTDAAGHVYVTGSFQSTNVDFDPGPSIYLLSTEGQFEEFILKLDTDGNFLWAYQPLSGNGDFSVGYSVSVDAAGNVYTTGAFNGTVDFDSGAGLASFTALGFMDGYMSKVDSNGYFVWAKQISSCSGIDYGRAIVVDTSGTIYVAGAFENSSDFDPGPGVLNLTAAGNSDVYISKFDTTGSLKWAKKMGGVSYEYVFGIATDMAGHIYSTGYFNGLADFDPGAGVYTLNSPSGYETFMSVLDTSGNFIQAHRLGGTDNNAGYSIAADACSNIYITGSFTGTTDFEPGSGIFNLTADDMDGYVLKLNQSYWTGHVSTDWHNPLNWGCNTVPDAQSNVVIPSAAIRFPVLFSNAEVRSIWMQPGSSLEVSPGKVCTVNGVNTN